MKKINAIRGMNDVLPEVSMVWQKVEAICAQLLNAHAYQQIRTPMLESTDLFARSIGAETDIVSKEMYTFADRNGDYLTLRPEGTASCVRAGIENGLFYNQKQRLWYVGPMFRHERPQKGRYRQFHQIGAEAYGWSTPDIEAQMIAMTATLWKKLGLEKTELQINSLGDSDARGQFKQALVHYLSNYKHDLDEDSQRRLSTNPLRILDSKNAQTQNILHGAPILSTFLSSKDQQDFDTLQGYLHDLQIPFKLNSGLVRGLDYYNNTVFEWINADFGAQSTVCAGGRYDGLVKQLGGHSTPAFGFAIGLERLVQILQEQGADLIQKTRKVDVYLISTGDQARSQALKLGDELATAGVCIEVHCGEGSMKNQFKRADKSGAVLALIIGEQEALDQQLSVKMLKQQHDQQMISQKQTFSYVTELLESL